MGVNEFGPNFVGLPDFPIFTFNKSVNPSISPSRGSEPVFCVCHFSFFTEASSRESDCSSVLFGTDLLDAVDMPHDNRSLRLAVMLSMLFHSIDPTSVTVNKLDWAKRMHPFVSMVIIDFAAPIFPKCSLDIGVKFKTIVLFETIR